MIHEIWGDDAALETQNALWVHISNLRKVLEPEHGSRSSGGQLQTRSPGYGLNVGSNEVDAEVDPVHLAVVSLDDLARRHLSKPIQRTSSARRLYAF